MRGFGHAMILIPSLHGRRLGTPGTTPAFLCTKYEEKNSLQINSPAAYASKTNNLLIIQIIINNND